MAFSIASPRDQGRSSGIDTTNNNIPLHRLSSQKYTPSLLTTSTTNPFSDSASFETASMTSTVQQGPLLHTAPFHPTKTLKIVSQGKAPISLPLNPSELETPMIDGETGEAKYVSLRKSRHSGSCSLLSANSPTESEVKLAETKYFFGPGRNPELRIGADEEFEVKGLSMWSRTCGFSCKFGYFEWRYAGKRERNEAGKRIEGRREAEKIDSLLVLERVEGKGKERRRKRVGQLVRGEGTRTSGSGSWSAGNGGVLELCLGGERNEGNPFVSSTTSSSVLVAEEIGEGNGGKGGDMVREEGTGEGRGEHLIDEITVVVTCLVMLKKEIDRTRAMQIAVIASGGGGGGS